MSDSYDQPLHPPPSPEGNSSPPGFIGSVINDAGERTFQIHRREASQRTKRRASIIAAITTFLIFTWAIRSCIPSEVTTWHRQQRLVQQQQLQQQLQRHVRVSSTITKTNNAEEEEANDAKDVTVTLHPVDDNIEQQQQQSSGPVLTSQRRQLRHMEWAFTKKGAPQKGAPLDLKKLHRVPNNPQIILKDPHTTQRREAVPLTNYKLNPLVKPDGYPWHRWKPPSPASGATYALNATKFVAILSQLGTANDKVATLIPKNVTLDKVPLSQSDDHIRMGPHPRPYIIRGGTVLRPFGRTGMFVTLVQRAVEMAATLVDDSPRMRLLAEGELPLIFDDADYPWCGDDLVPIFRLNSIKSPEVCRHSWPVMSLTYFKDPTNVQLAESPYEWDEMMTEWDAKYPWARKIPKVVWRGRITGYTYPDGERPRQELVRYGREYKDIMDIKPSTKRSQMDQDDFQKYKAILDIDGNAWSARLGKLLCFNSVVIKVEPEYVGYWEKELEPWVHYIPVQADFSDLEKTVRYVMDPANTEQMQQINKNSQQFCRTKLTMEQYTVDILWTLLAYAELLDGSPDFYNVWRSDANAYTMPMQEMKPWRTRVQIASEQ